MPRLKVSYFPYHVRVLYSTDILLADKSAQTRLFTYALFQQVSLNASSKDKVKPRPNSTHLDGDESRAWIGVTTAVAPGHVHLCAWDHAANEEEEEK